MRPSANQAGFAPAKPAKVGERLNFLSTLNGFLSWLLSCSSKFLQAVREGDRRVAAASNG